MVADAQGDGNQTAFPGADCLLPGSRFLDNSLFRVNIAHEQMRENSENPRLDTHPVQRPIVPKGGYFPAFFAVVLKFRVREGFALDWLLRHSVDAPGR